MVMADCKFQSGIWTATMMLLIKIQTVVFKKNTAEGRIRGGIFKVNAMHQCLASL
jgi:hypothetical protein